ncbi:hypothetical protein QR66_02435 [Chromobacterium piscinae]|nr:hypothetical protein QR66_02435 [Chromobacterium piscinae]
MKRRHDLQMAVAGLIRPLLGPDVLFCIDREEPFEADHLPAINLSRLSDSVKETAARGGMVQQRRQLMLSLDLYAEGESRYALLDAIEGDIYRALLTLGDAGLGQGETIMIGGAEFDQETLLAVVCATRIPITIDYTITL